MERPPAVVEGGELYREACATCHGLDGTGTDDGPQILSPVRPYATYVVRHGRANEMGFMTGMDPFDSDALADHELVAILDWLSAAAKPTTGEGLYVRFCGNCHGADAWGGRVGQDLTREIDETDELFEKVREGHGGARYADRTEYMPGWTRAALIDEDVLAIAAYIGSLPVGPDDEHDDDDDD
jgi:mono/diheme cytochrome c family protein